MIILERGDRVLHTPFPTRSLPSHTHTHTHVQLRSCALMIPGHLIHYHAGTVSRNRCSCEMNPVKICQYADISGAVRVRNVILYGSETGAAKMEDVRRLE